VRQRPEHWFAAQTTCKPEITAHPGAHSLDAHHCTLGTALRAAGSERSVIDERIGIGTSEHCGGRCVQPHTQPTTRFKECGS
jgi:hypothetical protein